MVEHDHDVPSDISQLGMVTRYEVLKHVRSRGILVLLAIIGLIVGLLMAIFPLLGEDYPSDFEGFMGLFTGWIDILVLIGVSALATGAIASEFDKRTGYLMFPNPLKRSTLLAGKFLAAFAVISTCMVAYYLLAIVLCVAITGEMEASVLTSLGFALLYVFAVTGVVFMISSLMRTSVASLVVTIFFLLIIFPMIQGLLMVFTTMDLTYLLSFAASPIYYSIVTPYPADAPDMLEAAMVLLAYGALPLVVSWVVFNRREMSG